MCTLHEMSYLTFRARRLSRLQSLLAFDEIVVLQREFQRIPRNRKSLSRLLGEENALLTSQ